MEYKWIHKRSITIEHSTHISGWRCVCWGTRRGVPAPGTGQVSALSWVWRPGARPGSPAPPGSAPPSRPRWTRTPAPSRSGPSVWSGCWAGTCPRSSAPVSRYRSSPFLWSTSLLWRYEICICKIRNYKRNTQKKTHLVDELAKFVDPRLALVTRLVDSVVMTRHSEHPPPQCRITAAVKK